MTEQNYRRSKLKTAYEECPIYGITGGSRDVVTLVKAMLEGGIRIIQYREKHKTPMIRYHEALALRQLTNLYGALLIIDDYVDLAIAVEADGVHIGQDDLPPTVVRHIVGNEMIIGWSTHKIEDIEAANRYADSIDYIGVGPIYATQTKPNSYPVGLAYVRYAAQHSVLPTVAIGGIKIHNASAVWAEQPTMICAVSEITEAERMADVIEQLWCKTVLVL